MILSVFDSVFSECGAFITQSVFFQILTIDTPKLTHEGEPALAQIVWLKTGDNPVSEPMMAYFTDAYMRHTMLYWVNWDYWDYLKKLDCCSYQLQAHKEHSSSGPFY